MKSGKEATKNQRTVIERLLLDEQVLVHINPQSSGITLPPHLLENRTVTLRLSKYFKGGLVTDEQHVTADLLFGSEYFTCIIPWQSIWGASSVLGEDYIWSEAAPPDVIDLFLAHQVQLGRQTGTAGPAPRTVTKLRRQNSHLRRVK